MVLYIIETEGGEVVREFFKEVERGLRVNDLKRNPFSQGRIKAIAKGVYACSWKIVYPAIYPYSLIWFVLSLSFNFPLFWVLFPTGLLLAQGLFFNSLFYYYINVLGLRKKGYKGSIKLIRHSEAIRRYL